MSQVQDTINFDVPIAEVYKTEGMTRALLNAESKIPCWGGYALQMLRKFIGTHTGPFMMEDVRAYAYANGLPRPERDQAWGAIVRRAFKCGIIVKIGQGVAKDPTRHRGYTALWEKANQ